MKRIEKTIKEYKQQLTYKGIENISEFVEMIIQTDITKGKYTRFLLDCFINGKFRMEDLQGGLESTIGQAVNLFHKHKGKLPEDMRSITKYTSPGDLWQAVREYEQVLTGKEEKKSEKEKAYAETEFIYHDEDSGFQIVSPLTEYSSKWWGKGTRWCTASDNNNQFEYYAKDAPLFIILMPDGHKLQLWKGENNIQFMDEADNDVDRNYIEKNWSVLEPICLWLNTLFYIPKNYLTQDICLSIIKNNKDRIPILSLLSEKYKTYDVCLLAVQKDGTSLRNVPDKFKTSKLYKIAVKQNGEAIQYVTDSFFKKNITPNLCLLAVKSNGLALQNIPPKYVTYDLCKIAVQQNGKALRYMLREQKTSELCKLAIRQCGEALQYVPEEMKTPDLCKLAVEKDGYILQYVPEEYKTPELCKIAVQENGFAIRFIPKEFQTSELCQLVIEQNGYALKVVPEKYKTPELCKIAVKKDGLALQFVPEEYKTYELCKKVLEKDKSIYSFLPKHIQLKIAVPEFNIPEFIIPDYTEQYDRIRSLFPDKELSYKP